MNLDPAYIELLRNLITIPAISREEHDRSDFLEQWLKAAGLMVTRIHNNLLVGDPDPKPATPGILLNSHLDTVAPADGWDSDPFTPKVEGDRITGLGSNDAGGSVVAMIAAYRKMYRQMAGKVTLLLVISAEEEVSGERGIGSVLETLNHFEAAVVGEPTGMQPAVAERGLMVLDGMVRGEAGHAARGEGVNAIHLAMEDIASIGELRFTRKSEWLPEPGAQVTMIQAGHNHNVLPDVCRYVVDVRSNDLYSNSDLLQMIRSVCRAELTPRSTRLNPSGLQGDHFLMEVIHHCRLKPFGSSTLSDMALIPFPSVKMGPGDSARSHTAGEFITVPEVETGVEVYCRFLDSLMEVLVVKSHR